jgi:hypothetical protein
VPTCTLGIACWHAENGLPREHAAHMTSSASQRARGVSRSLSDRVSWRPSGDLELDPCAASGGSGPRHSGGDYGEPFVPVFNIDKARVTMTPYLVLISVSCTHRDAEEDRSVAAYYVDAGPGDSSRGLSGGRRRCQHKGRVRGNIRVRSLSLSPRGSDIGVVEPWVVQSMVHPAASESRRRCRTRLRNRRRRSRIRGSAHRPA